MAKKGKKCRIAFGELLIATFKRQSDRVWTVSLRGSRLGECLFAVTQSLGQILRSNLKFKKETARLRMQESVALLMSATLRPVSVFGFTRGLPETIQ